MRCKGEKTAAFLWDESFLWGLMAYKALTKAGLPFELVRADDVRSGCLERFSALFVPGGWASNKLKALGPDGIRGIKKFVHDGGAYLGFCGGAGLATLDGIGLMPVRRRPTKDRVPSFSGRIRLTTSDHPLWEGISEPVFHAWWPSQFMIEDDSVTVLGTYGQAMPDAFSSDVNVGEAETNGKWTDLERIYQINLDPKGMLHDPAVVEGAYGKGRVLLSLVHFDTPGDIDGTAVLRNMWRYLLPDAEQGLWKSPHPRPLPGGYTIRERENHEHILELEKAISGLIELGERNFLWYWRNSLLLLWRRGVRGLEYCTLSVMVKEIADMLKMQVTEDGRRKTDEKLKRIRDLLVPFVKKAERLLLLERDAMQNGHITYEKCDDPEIQSLRDELFSRSKSHGGLFKKLVDEIDGLLFSILTQEKRRQNDTA